MKLNNLLKKAAKKALFIPIIYSLNTKEATCPAPKIIFIQAASPIIKYEKKVVILDPGHGMKNRGKKMDWGISYKDYKEAEIVLEKAKKIREMLDEKKYNVYLTREDNTTLCPIESRPELANKLHADLFISIHVNDFKGWKSISGSEIYYRKSNDQELKNKSKELAKIAAKHLEEITSIPNRWVIQEDYLMLKGVKCPAALLDVGYLLNEKDRNNILNTDYVEKAIVKTIEEILK